MFLDLAVQEIPFYRILPDFGQEEYWHKGLQMAFGRRFEQKSVRQVYISCNPLCCGRINMRRRHRQAGKWQKTADFSIYPVKKLR
jgi:hypothetical protein